MHERQIQWNPCGNAVTLTQLLSAFSLNQIPSSDTALTLLRTVFIILYDSSQSKITNLSNVIFSNQNISGSQVSMDQLFALQILHSTGNLQPTRHNTLSVMNEMNLKKCGMKYLWHTLCTVFTYLLKGNKEKYKIENAVILSTGRCKWSIYTDIIKCTGFYSVACN